MKKFLFFILFSLVLNSFISQAAKVLVFSEKFEPTNWFQWTSIQGGNEGASCGYYAYQDAMYFSGSTSRYAETVDLNLTYVNYISFDLFISYYSSTGCDVANSGDDIYLEYSTDGGTTWINIQTYKAYSYYYYTFTAIAEYLPLAARTSKTRLRWSQTKFTGSGYDVWGLDEVELYQNCTPSSEPSITASNTQLCNSDTITLTASSLTNSYLWSTGETTSSIDVSSIGSYYVMSPDLDGCLAFDTVYVTSAKPNIVAYAEDPSVCMGGTTQLNVALGGDYTETFDPISTTMWSSISLGYVETNCGGSSNAVYFYGAGTYYDDRFAITNDLDLTGSGEMQFDLYIDYNYNCESADWGEDVYFDYSTDGGANWTNVGVYYTGTTDYDPFATVTVTLPSAAQTTHTRLRWYQATYSCQSCDYWGLDNIKISTLDTNIAAKPYTYSWSPSTGLSNPYIANPIVSTVTADVVYTVTVTDTLMNCVNTDTVSLTVFNPSLASISMQGSNTICPGYKTELSANSGKYYLWSNGDTTQKTTVTSAGTYTVTVTYPGGCVSTSNPLTLYEYPTSKPVVTASGPLEFCYNDSVTLTSSSALSYQWSNGATSNSITVTNTGKYTVTGYDSYGCLLTSDTAYVVNHGPVTRIFADTTAICKGGSLELNVKVGGSNYETDFESGIDNSFWDQTSNGYVGNNCGGNSKAIYFYGAGNYYDDRYAITKDMDLALDGTIQFDLFIAYSGGSCEAADYYKDVYFDYSTDGGNTWNNIDVYYAGYNTYDPFLTISLAIPAGAKTDKTRLRWMQSYYSCISCDFWGLDNVKITTTDSSSSNTTYTYSWTPTLNLSDATSQNPVASIDSTTTFEVTVVDALLGCSGKDTFTLSVFTTPTDIITNTNSVICQGDTLKLASTLAEKYQWSTGDTTQVIYVSQQGQYSVQTTFKGGCIVSDSISMNIVVPVVASLTASGPTEFCKGGSVTLTATPGVSYNWSNGLTTQSVTVGQTGNYYAVVTDVNGCYYKTSSVSVLNADPAVQITVDSTEVCEGSSIQLLATTQGDVDENFEPQNNSFWTTTTGYVGTMCGGTNDAMYFYDYTRYAETVDLDLSNGGTIEFDLYIDYWYNCESADYGEDVYLEYSTNGGLTWYTINIYYAAYGDYDPFTTVTENIPSAAQTSSTRLRWSQPYFTDYGYDYCGLDNIKVSNSNGITYDYVWSPTSGLSSSTAANPTAVIDSTITYTVTVTAPAYGCVSTDDITIIAKPAPNAVFTYTGNGLTINFSNASTYVTNYYWQFGDGSVSFNSNVSHTYAQAGTYQVILKIQGDCGLDYDTQTVVVSSSGVEEIVNGNAIQLYPNPTKGDITIEWNNANNFEIITIQILSINGEVIKEEAIDSNSGKKTFDLSLLSKGIYFIKATTTEGSFHQKIILN